jgi:hypothetical protein
MGELPEQDHQQRNATEREVDRMGPAPASEPWRRQPGETPKAYYYFTLYRDLGPQRTIGQVQQQVNKSAGFLNHLSCRHHWVARAAAFDDQQDEIEINAWNRECEKTARRHAKICMAVIGKALEKIAASEPATYEDAVNQALMAMKYERVCRGMPAEDKGRPDPSQPDPDQSHVTRVTEVIVRTRKDIQDLRNLLQPGQTLLFDPGPLPPEEPQAPATRSAEEHCPWGRPRDRGPCPFGGR